jgi:hypothetical protein
MEAIMMVLGWRIKNKEKGCFIMWIKANTSENGTKIAGKE